MAVGWSDRQRSLSAVTSRRATRRTRRTVTTEGGRNSRSTSWRMLWAVSASANLCVSFFLSLLCVTAEELRRRGISQVCASVEAGLDRSTGSFLSKTCNLLILPRRVRIPFAALSRLLQMRRCTKGKPGKMFRSKMSKQVGAP